MTKIKNFIIKNKWLLIAFFAVLGLDIITKNWIVSEFSGGRNVGFIFDNASIVHPAFWGEITSFFNIVLVFNKGVSFSMLYTSAAFGKWIFLAINLLISGLLFALLVKEKSTFLKIIYTVIIAGAIGNALDRIRFGAVVDFLDFHLWGKHWPSFNVADIAISVGVGLFILFEIIKWNKERKVAKNKK